MASIKLINSVKYSKTLIRIYSITGNIFIKVLKLFLKPDPKLIVFVSSGGKLMNDSPKCIYDYIRKDPRFNGYKLVWAFRDTSKFEVPYGEKVQLDTLRYYINVLKARVWVTNVSMTRGLSFTGIHTFQLNSWHGTAIKMIGADVINKPDAYTNASRKNNIIKDPNLVYLAQGKHDVTVWQRAFLLSRDNIACIGLPRNDDLVSLNRSDVIDQIKSKLGLPRDKKVIMYAPTFRDYDKKEGKYLVLSPPIDLSKWKKYLGDEYVLLFRAHPSVVEVMNISNNDNFVKNVSGYPVLNELMLVSDIMISDYSSILFDYSILGRPLLSFSYDYEAYTKGRGVYFDIRHALDCIGLDNEDRLLETIKNMDYSKRSAIAVAFRDKYVQYYGNSTEKAVNIIYDRITDN